MAGRVHHSLQRNSFTFLFSSSSSFPSYKPINSKNRIHFCSNFFSSSSKRAALYCTCSTSSSNAETSDPFVLTTPLYYVNAPPHMGSAYITIAADAVARFQERGLYSLLAQMSMERKLLLPLLHVVPAQMNTAMSFHKLIGRFGKMSFFLRWEYLLEISYDKFIRTTDPKHVAIVEEFYSKVLASGDIYRADYEGLYCVNCEEYKDEKELLDNNCCPMHLKPCVSRKEDNYFFALSKY